MIETLQFAKKNFNPLFFHLNKYMKDNTVRRILVYGSSSAAKTYSISQNLIIDGCINRKYNSIMFRKEGSNIKDTIKNDLSEIVGKIVSNPFLTGLFDKYEFEFRCSLGNIIRLRGLDNDGKIKGLKGFRKVYFDELDQFTFADWKEANRRLRGEENQQLIASWNPVSEHHWIKTDFIDKITWKDLPKIVDNDPYSQLHENSFVRVSEDGRTILIKTVYQDNKWVVGGQVGDVTYGRVDEQVLADFAEMEEIYPYDYMVYGLGEWGVVRPDKPYFYNYKDDIHYSTSNAYDFHPLAETWLSFDFNYDPTTCTVFQVHSDCILGMRCYSTIGGTRALCRLMKSDPDLMMTRKEFWTITGDSSGNSKSSTAGDVTDYDIIKEELEVGDNIVRVNTRNKAHVYSRRLCDTFFYKVPFAMDYRCANLRNDLLKAKPKEGTEELYKDRSKGFGMDHIDNFRYFVDAKFYGGIDDINRFAELCKIRQKSIA